MNEVAKRPDDRVDAFEAAFARLQARVETACATEARWADQVAAGIRAALAFVASDPERGRALVNGAMARGSDGFADYERMVAHFGEELIAGRGLRPTGDYLPQITEKAMVGGVAMLVAQRLDRGQHAELPSLAPEAIQFVLTPYLGAEEARMVAVRHG
jgi:hypothetical protein